MMISLSEVLKKSIRWFPDGSSLDVSLFEIEILTKSIHTCGFHKKTLKRNFPGGNDGGLQAHPLKTLTDGRIIKFGCPGPGAVAPMVVSKPYLGVRFLKYQFNLLNMHCKTFI